MDFPLWLFLAAPLAAAVVNALFFRRVPSIAAFVSLVSVFLTLYMSWQMLGANLANEGGQWRWIQIGDFEISFGFKLDELAQGMMFIVTFIGALVHIFSLGYMEGQEGGGRYFAGLSMFMFSMTGIVLADNFVMMFIFWELVGVSSYILIGHYFQKNTAAAAAKKAFLVNRIGDFGFMIGILMLWALTGSIMFDGIESTQEVVKSGSIAAPLLTIITLLIFCGAVGKSAQMPLHVWLPDAMEGPTPVSALIHAATMVAAGVYMLVRVDFLIAASEAGVIIAWVGGITAAFAAVVAIGQDDIKRILAYSTLSQLGYMVMAVGLGGSEEGMFHLYTHAFFKALLFLGAGAVIYACHHEQNIWKMGGLGRRMPVTFFMFLLGTAALIAFPGTSGFASKETILHLAHDKESPLFYVGAAVAFLTPFYMTRLVVVAFFRKPRTDSAKKASEVPVFMWGPLVILGILSIISAMPFVTQPLQVLYDVNAAAEGSHDTFGMVTIVSLVAVAVGVLGAIFLYRGRDTDPIQSRLLANKFYFDELYQGIVRYGQDFIAYMLDLVDKLIVELLFVTGSAKLTQQTGKWLRHIQSGSLQAYSVIFALGVIGLLYFVLAK